MLKRLIIKIGYFAILILLTGCICPGISPHDNFKEHLYSKIGKRLDEIPSYWWPYEEDLISSKRLPNGNIENKYKYRGSCRYIFEINPKTKKIVAARFEGKETDCVVNP